MIDAYSGHIRKDRHARVRHRPRAARCNRSGPGRGNQRVHLDRDQGGDGRTAASLRARERPYQPRELCAFRRAGAPDGRVSVLVSSGEAEIGLQQVSELLSNPEVEVIGMLPAELQLTTIYSAGVTATAKEGEAAKALIKALTVPSAALIFKARGLDPT